MIHARQAPRPTRRSRAKWTALFAAMMVAANALAQSPALSLDMPAQPLDRALQTLARQAGVQIVFVTELTAQRQAPALKGTLTVREALERLTANTGLVVRAQSGDTYTLDRPQVGARATLPTVTVTASPDTLPRAYAGGQVATGGRLGLLGNVDAMETPFNVTSYTSELIENTQSMSLKDVLDNDPSVRASSPRGAETDSLMIRGFEFTGREAIVNGMYGMADNRGTMIEAAERIEIHKGPSAMLNGVSPWGSSPGGSINYVLKRAEDTPLTRLTTSYASGGQLGAHADLGRRFGENKEFGVRLNAVHRDGDLGVDHTNNKESMAALALDYRGDKLRLFGDFGYQDRMLRGGWSSTRIGSTVRIPDAPEATINSKQPWEFFDGQNRYAMIRAEYDLTPNWTAGAAFGDNTSDEQYLLTIDSINNVNGNKSGTPYFIPAQSKNTTKEISLKGKFDTGFVSHNLSVIASKNEASRGQLTYDVPGYGNNSLPSNIYRPSYFPAPNISGLNSSAVRMTSRYDYSGIAVADIMKLLDDRLVIMAGARQQKLGFTNYNYNTGAATSGYTKDRISPSVGLVYKLLPGLSVYGSYIESLNPGGTVSTFYANSGQILPPYVTKQKEAGVKYDFGSVTTTASLFDVSVPSSLEVASITSGGRPTLAQDGEERHRGLEFNVFGEPVRGWRVLGGFMLLDAEMTKTQGGINDGKRARGAPRANINIGTEWDVPGVAGLTLTGRALHTTREYIDLTNTNARSIPAWTRYDVGARYATKAFNTPMMLRLQIDNVFDRNYWAAASRGVLTMGSPRTIRLSATFDF
ncbi:TonB-dependent receptor [Pigmentiphaga aceris]|uniref:TonB-dependent receptor n=1 Tax=Pigmentiphaga aceris TaxID=1940612 RepID=UPI001651C40F|nr:TonB-dependent receptor [Pigmentiphaga aceris]